MGRKTGALFLEAVLFLLAFLPQSFVEADESAECSCDLGDLGDSIEEKAAGLCDDESECRRRAVVIIKKNMEEGGRYAACKAELYKLQEKIKTQETPRDNCAEKEKMWEKQRSELEQEKDECLRTSDAHRTQKQDLEDRVRYMDGLTRAMISEKRFAEERRNISEKENEDLKTRVRVLTHKLGVLTAMVQKLHISHMIKDMGIAMLQAEAKQAAEEMETNHKKDVAAAEERVLQECKEKFCFDSSGNLNAAVFIEHNISKENRSFLLEQLNCSKENQGDTKREWRFWRKGANDSSRPKKSADHSESNGSSHGNNIHLVLRHMVVPVMNMTREPAVDSPENSRKISLAGYPEVAGLFCVTVFKSTLDLEVRDCCGLLTLDGVGKCVELKKFSISNCGMLTNISDLKDCVNLEMLTLSGCKTLRNLTPLKGHRTLSCITISHCERMMELDLEGATNLMQLNISDCEELKDVHVSRCTRLEVIDIHDCVKLEKLHGLTYLRELKTLILAGNRELSAVEGINELINRVEKLSLKNCEKLEDLKFLDFCNFLKEIVVAGSNVTEEKKQELRGKGVRIVNEVKVADG